MNPDTSELLQGLEDGVKFAISEKRMDPDGAEYHQGYADALRYASRRIVEWERDAGPDTAGVLAAEQVRYQCPACDGSGVEWLDPVGRDVDGVPFDRARDCRACDGSGFNPGLEIRCGTERLGEPCWETLPNDSCLHDQIPILIVRLGPT